MFILASPLNICRVGLICRLAFFLLFGFSCSDVFDVQFPWSALKVWEHCELIIGMLRTTTSEVVKLCKMQKVVNFTHFNSKNTYISNSAYMHGFCSFIYNILLIFLSLFSLSVSILGCYKFTQLCPSQFASNPPNTVQPPLNHHHHNPSQLITTHDIPITKSTKNKGKSNPKSNLQRKTQQLRTQNQTFNKNPSTQTQVLESYGKGKDQQKKN